MDPVLTPEQLVEFAVLLGENLPAMAYLPQDTMRTLMDMGTLPFQTAEIADRLVEAVAADLFSSSKPWTVVVFSKRCNESEGRGMASRV